LEMKVLPKVAHQELSYYYWNADIIIDQFKAGVFGVISLEAIACGRPVITYVSSEYPEHVSLPLKDIDSSEKIVEAIKNADNLTKLWKAQHNYLKQNHDPQKIVRRVMEIYQEVCETSVQ